MKNYILLLRKDDIIDLFKYGEWYSYCPSVMFDGDIEKLRENNKACESLFKNANAFDYSIEYYMLHIKSGDRKSTLVYVEDVIGVYALDEQSQLIGIELSPAVKIYPPIWPNAFTDFQIRKGIDNCIKGIATVQDLFGLQFTKMRRKGFVDDDVIKEVVEENIKNIRPTGQPLGNKSIWVYLLRYERHQNYPKDMRGFFIDSVHVYNNFVKGEELDAPMHEKSTAGKLIEALPPQTKYSEILSSISLGNEYVDKSDKLFKDYCAIAPLFLMLKSTFSNGIHLNEQYSGFNFDEYAELLKKKAYEKVIKYSLYLLSISLGWEGTYQSYYERSAFPFLKEVFKENREG